MKSLNPIMLGEKEVLPLIEGGKGISVSNGESSGAWAAAGGVGTFSAVNADAYDENGNLIPIIYHGRTRRERHEELIAYAIKGGIAQARIAHDLRKGQGLLNMNVLWEMGAVEPILHGILDKVGGLVNGITCGAGMPYKIAEISSQYKIYYYPIVSSARAFWVLWRRAYHKFQDWLGAVVYEDPWLAGGHNGLSRAEDAEKPEPPFERVLALRNTMREFGLGHVPIIMAGGVWFLREWVDWINNPDLGPIGFQFGTRPLLTKESPISDAWKKKLVTLKKGDIFLNKFSPTGFYSSAVNNKFLHNLKARSDRQVAYSTAPVSDHDQPFPIGPRQRLVYLTKQCVEKARTWIEAGFKEALRTPDSTLVFVTSEEAHQIHEDQVNCMGCLSACLFSNWSQSPEGTTGRKADPRSFCIQKTLQTISHSSDVEDQLMFSGHNGYRFALDPFYKNGFIPSVKELLERIQTGD
ncbi:MAG: 2-nitropropane dioxygenase [Alphaproteobacteria bacterium RIFCSPLOWO2_01_FULL_45_8]|nr:MAG: 2-nitropropane dioxygenase [Alphaproteobacteria bacterium GWA1_45_9]OFW89463.1 MAG: 2-nitropropane dioxygenase [Alphaproteobacteria bacterium RIFCSPHIGHO2_01_FULL_41_14]OFW96603.1 MAG: 2-nitropropane dioxygenase [Alphaproteobacteria bacterium RIFCSPLOWO2_01_FULL_45_8]HCI48635.1 nitronate monooxygenase [Holosporales bacterium]